MTAVVPAGEESELLVGINNEGTSVSESWSSSIICYWQC